MPKLKKQSRPPATASPKSAPSTSSSSSSTIRAPSSSGGTLPRSGSLKGGLGTSPIALRTAARPVLATVSAQQARGELVELDGSVEGGGEGDRRSRSATRSSASSKRSPSPTVPSLHRPSPTHSRSHTHSSSGSQEQNRPPTPFLTRSASNPNAPPSLPDSPSDPFYHPALASSPSLGSSSAFSSLRKRLDTDKAAREAQKVREEYESHGGGRLRKKLPEKVVERKVEGLLAHEAVEGEIEGAMMGVNGVEEGVQTDGEEENGKDFGAKEEEEELLDEAVQADFVPAESATPSDAPSSSPSFLFLPLVVSPSALVLAPARLTYTLTTRTLTFGLNTSQSILRCVPVAGRFVPPSPPPPPPPSLATTAPNGTPAAFPTPPSSFSSPSFAASAPLPPPSTAFSTSSAATTSTFKSPASLRASLARRLNVPESKLPSSPSELLFDAAQIGLGLGLASVLVGVAVGGMAWDRVFGRGRGRKAEGAGKVAD
ncbi:hypothetical protein JCM6882_004735 [Rhodosporidiobolus microsporus]